MTETNYAVPPGSYLEEWIEKSGFNVYQTAEKLGWSYDKITDFILGTNKLSAVMACELSEVTNIPLLMWIKIEIQYQKDVNRLSETE